MTTAKEALESIHKQREEAGIAFLGWVNLTVEHYSAVVDALKKQIPKKSHISLHGTTDWNTRCRCPVCRKDVFGTQKYCGNCGQALDWSDTE